MSSSEHKKKVLKNRVTGKKGMSGMDYKTLRTQSAPLPGKKEKFQPGEGVTVKGGKRRKRRRTRRRRKGRKSRRSRRHSRRRSRSRKRR